MAHKIFLSHKWEDKPVVEPVALRLRDIFGQDAIFYDAWSIRPGDGIIDAMNKGLEAPEFVFFFVSDLSLNSELVKMEWQNALYKASKGTVRVIPVRVGNVALPPILSQTLYIDLYSVGLEAGLNQIVNVVQGNSTFTPQHLGFSNLTATLSVQVDGSVILTVRASHLMEPNPEFVLLASNDEKDIVVSLTNDAPYRGGFNANAFGAPEIHGFTVAPLGGAITPERPLQIVIKLKSGGKPLQLHALMHGWSAPFRPVPIQG